MQRTLLSLITFLSFQLASAGTYEVSIENLTAGQPMTPALIVAHGTKYSNIFKVGQKASQGLKELATDGIRKTLEQEVQSQKDFYSSHSANDFSLPGQPSSLKIKLRKHNSLISLVAMLARTNDAFVAVQGVSLPKKVGQSTEYLAHVYDAGVELNTESCNHIPAPPCDSHNIGELENGYILPHPGIQNIGDLNPLRDLFAPIAAKIKITKL